MKQRTVHTDGPSLISKPRGLATVQASHDHVPLINYHHHKFRAREEVSCFVGPASLGSWLSPPPNPTFSRGSRNSCSISHERHTDGVKASRKTTLGSSGTDIRKPRTRGSFLLTSTTHRQRHPQVSTSIPSRISSLSVYLSIYRCAWHSGRALDYFRCSKRARISRRTTVLVSGLFFFPLFDAIDERNSWESFQREATISRLTLGRIEGRVGDRDLFSSVATECFSFSPSSRFSEPNVT